MPTSQLILMRHAAAAGMSEGTDHSRRLEAIGHQEAKRVGVRLAMLGVRPDLIVSSSAIRCRETLDALVPELDDAPLIEFLDSLYNSDSDQLLSQIDEELTNLRAASGDLSDTPPTLMLLAHNPGVSMLAFELASANDADASRLRAGFSPASFAIFEIEDDAECVSRFTARLVVFERTP